MPGKTDDADAEKPSRDVGKTGKAVGLLIVDSENNGKRRHAAYPSQCLARFRQQIVHYEVRNENQDGQLCEGRQVRHDKDIQCACKDDAQAPCSEQHRQAGDRPAADWDPPEQSAASLDLSAWRTRPVPGLARLRY